MAEAIGTQGDYNAWHKRPVTLSDILIVSAALGYLLQRLSPRTIELNGIFAFEAVGLKEG